VKRAERATIVQQQVAQDCFWLPVHSFAYLQPCCWTKQRRAESECTNPAAANSVCAASPGFTCSDAIQAIACGYHSWTGKVREHGDPWRIGRNLVDVT
jgi:hypothetical protein